MQTHHSNTQVEAYTAQNIKFSIKDFFSKCVVIKEQSPRTSGALCTIKVSLLMTRNIFLFASVFS